MRKIALVTGATSGIGLATAEMLAASDYDIIITGRRENRLQEASLRLEREFGVRVLPLSFDVRSYNEVDKYLGNLPDKWQHIDVLVNNAGLAVGLNRVDEGVVDDWERMIDTNIKGLLYVTRVVSRYKRLFGI